MGNYYNTFYIGLFYYNLKLQHDDGTVFSMVWYTTVVFAKYSCLPWLLYIPAVFPLYTSMKCKPAPGSTHSEPSVHKVRCRLLFFPPADTGQNLVPRNTQPSAHTSLLGFKIANQLIVNVVLNCQLSHPYSLQMYISRVWWRYRTKMDRRETKKSFLLQHQFFHLHGKTNVQQDSLSAHCRTHYILIWHKP